MSTFKGTVSCATTEIMSTFKGIVSDDVYLLFCFRDVTILGTIVQIWQQPGLLKINTEIWMVLWR